MTARVLDTESHFKAGEVVFLPKGPLLKRLSCAHCAKLITGERIWLPGKEVGSFNATTVTKVVVKDTMVEISYKSGSSSGHFTIQRRQPTPCYRFLDEEALLPAAEKVIPDLKLVGKG